MHQQSPPQSHINISFFLCVFVEFLILIGCVHGFRRSVTNTFKEQLLEFSLFSRGVHVPKDDNLGSMVEIKREESLENQGQLKRWENNVITEHHSQPREQKIDIRAKMPSCCDAEGDGVVNLSAPFLGSSFPFLAKKKARRAATKDQCGRGNFSLAVAWLHKSSLKKNQWSIPQIELLSIKSPLLKKNKDVNARMSLSFMWDKKSRKSRLSKESPREQRGILLLFMVLAQAAEASQITPWPKLLLNYTQFAGEVLSKYRMQRLLPVTGDLGGQMPPKWHWGIWRQFIFSNLSMIIKIWLLKW